MPQILLIFLVLPKKDATFAGMAKKFKLRKMYFVCRNGKVIDENIAMTNAYRKKDDAQQVCDNRQQQDYKLWDDRSQPLPKYTVEAFFLAHESLFDSDNK